MTVELDNKLPKGPWLARISVTSGLDERTEQARVTFPAKPGAPASVPVENDSIPWWVWAIAAGLLLLLLILLATVRRRSKARPTDDLPTVSGEGSASTA